MMIKVNKDDLFRLLDYVLMDEKKDYELMVEEGKGGSIPLHIYRSIDSLAVQSFFLEEYHDWHLTQEKTHAETDANHD